MNEEYTPLVSIVVACYNHEGFVQDCINSIIKQTYQNIELIIIDDGSSDSSVEKINALLEICYERFVRFEFRYRANEGLTSTLNEALVWCRGEYYCPFASDDIMISNRILLQLNYLKENDQCAGVFGAYEIIDEYGVVCSLRKKSKKKYKFRDIYLHSHELPAPTQLLKMSVIKEIGGYADNIIIEDWYMWLKISKLGYTLDYLDILFVKYRKHDSNISNKLGLILQERLRIIEMFNDSKLLNDAYAYAFLVSANEYLMSDFKTS
ncbi:glycosyltransferase family 2 protein [Acinetobacter guillouiae]|uniref:glycosyltransferase family 2 protein n=1 Tax=Acinetobacter guillouiae TaxID=106649 RepID=UPI00148EFC50|nr:glycosyltransferase [Acinetobacter guillouiae]